MSTTLQERPVLLDQRHMSGDRKETVEEIQAFWQANADKNRERHGISFFNRPGAQGFRSSERELHAYVSDGRWVAGCPMDGCNGGVALWQEHERAACLDCGTIFTSIRWPDMDEQRAAVEALAARPPEHRHWHPWEERARDLRHENIQHGYAPQGKPAAGTVQEIAAASGLSPATVEKVLRALDEQEKKGGPAVLRD